MPEFIGWSGGSMVTLLNGAVISNFTAASSIDAIETGKSSSNSTASASVKGLLSVGAVQTSESSVALPGGGVGVVSHAKTAGVSVLNGLVRVDAVDTIASASLVNDQVSSSSHTTYVGLHIGNAHIPLTINPNTRISIPGVLTVILNSALTKAGPDPKTIRTDSAGLYISLLSAQGGFPKGTQIWLNPSHAQIGVFYPGPSVVGGLAYGTRINAAVGDLVGIRSDPTAFQTMPAGGTQGLPRNNSTAAINIPSVLVGSAISTTIKGTATASLLDSQTSAHLAKINLLGGLITADALDVSAHANEPVPGTITLSAGMHLVNLTIGGHPIDLNVAPNTQVNLLNLAIVTVNQQIRTSNAILIRALDIKLTTAAYGLKAGAEIQIAVAAASDGQLFGG